MISVQDGLQGSLLQADISEIIVHEADEPNAVADFLDAVFLTGEHGRDIDLFSVHADATARQALGELIYLAIFSSAYRGGNGHSAAT